MDIEVKEKISLKEKLAAFWDKLNWGNVKIDVSEDHDGSDVRLVRKRRPVLLIGSIVLILGILVACLMTMNLADTRFGWETGWEFIGGLFRAPYNKYLNFFPYNIEVKDWSSWCYYMEKVWLPFLVETGLPSLWSTVELCFLATLFGGLISIPVYYLCARNVAKHGYIYEPFRIINDILRTIPTITICTIFVLIYGATNFTGIIAMTIFTIGIIYKIMYEYIETLDMSPFEAIYSAGGMRFQAVTVGLRPSIKPMFFANMLYVFEMNIRGSLILGYAGIIDSLGYKISDWSHDALDLWKIGVVLVPLFVLVFILQLASNFIGRKMR